KLDVHAAEPKGGTQEPPSVLPIHALPSPRHPPRGPKLVAPGLGIALGRPEQRREPELNHVAREDDAEDPQGPDEPNEELHAPEREGSRPKAARSLEARAESPNGTERTFLTPTGG